jgi:hypothetical protein
MPERPSENYISVYSNGGVNYFSFSGVASINASGNLVGTFTGLTVGQAYIIDQKIDDGLPPTGQVIAKFNNGAGVVNANGYAAPNPAGCYVTTTNSYNLPTYTNSTNCALSFRFQ